MTTLKLCDQTGDILGAIIVPDVTAFNAMRELVFHYAPPIRVTFSREPVPDSIELQRIIFIPALGRRDAVMLVQGSMWDFEKVEGCFFVPGWDFAMKGRK